MSDQPRITHTVLDSPVGELRLVAADGVLSALLMESDRHPRMLLGEREDGGFGAAQQQLAEYFAGRRTTFDLPLAPAGPAFDQRVWQLLATIPHGETRSYSDLARQLGGPGLAQAVGAANGRNPVSIIVPCHRVIGADGSLTGYAGGLERKRTLLHLENPNLFGEQLLF